MTRRNFSDWVRSNHHMVARETEATRVVPISIARNMKTPDSAEHLLRHGAWKNEVYRFRTVSLMRFNERWGDFP